MLATSNFPNSITSSLPLAVENTSKKILNLRKLSEDLNKNNPSVENHSIIQNLIELFEEQRKKNESLNLPTQKSFFSSYVTERIKKNDDQILEIQMILNKALMNFSPLTSAPKENSLWVEQIKKMLHGSSGEDVAPIEKIYLTIKSLKKEIQDNSAKEKEYKEQYPEGKFYDIWQLQFLIDKESREPWELFCKKLEHASLSGDAYNIKAFKEIIQIHHVRNSLEDWLKTYLLPLVKDENDMGVLNKVIQNHNKKKVEAFNENKPEELRSLTLWDRIIEIPEGALTKFYHIPAFLDDGSKIEMEKQGKYFIPRKNQEFFAYTSRLFSGIDRVLKRYGEEYTTGLSPETNRPQIKFLYKTSEERTQQLEKLRNALKFSKKPLSQSFQLPSKDKDSRFAILLTFNESHDLLGFGATNKPDPLFYAYMSYKEDLLKKKNKVLEAIKYTKSTDPEALAKESINEKIEKHELAKNFLKENFDLLGAKIGFIKADSKPEVPESLLGNEKIVKDLNPEVFSWEITYGDGDGIDEAGKRIDETEVIFSVPGLVNMTEAPYRSHWIAPGEAVRQFSDDTQGRVRKAFPNEYSELYNCAAHVGYHALSHVLTNEITTKSVYNGYFSPTTENIDKVITDLKENGDKIDYAYTTSIPKGGNKPVSTIHVPLAAFDKNIPSNLRALPEKERIVEYICALQGYKVQFNLAIEANRSGGKQVFNKIVDAGIGPHNHHPDIIAKAFYHAAKQYEQKLLDCKVKVSLQCRQKGMEKIDIQEMKESNTYKVIEALFDI